MNSGMCNPGLARLQMISGVQAPGMLLDRAKLRVVQHEPANRNPLTPRQKRCGCEMAEEHQEALCGLLQMSSHSKHVPCFSSMSTDQQEVYSLCTQASSVASGKT